MLDASAAAIVAQTAQNVINTQQIRGNLIPFETGTMTSIDASLARIGDALWVIADTTQTIASTMQELKVSSQADISLQTEANGFQAKLVAIIKESNDFQRAVTEQALTLSGQPIPKLPPWSERIKALVKDTQEMMSISKIEGFFNEMLKNSLKQITLIITESAIYTSIVAKFEEAKKAILSIKIPSPENSKSKAATLLGSKAPDFGTYF
jgi:hypothetical protein